MLQAQKTVRFGFVLCSHHLKITSLTSLLVLLPVFRQIISLFIICRDLLADGHSHVRCDVPESCPSSDCVWDFHERNPSTIHGAHGLLPKSLTAAKVRQVHTSMKHNSCFVLNRSLIKKFCRHNRIKSGPGHFKSGEREKP